MAEPKTLLPLPSHITATMNLIDSQINSMLEIKGQLLATFLRAERVDGKWGVVDGNTHAFQVEEKKEG